MRAVQTSLCGALIDVWGLRCCYLISRMEMKRSSLRGFPILSATIAMSIAAVRSGTSWSFTSPAEPGANCLCGRRSGSGGCGSRSRCGGFCSSFLVLHDFAGSLGDEHQQNQPEEDDRHAEHNNQSRSSDGNIYHCLVNQKHLFFSFFQSRVAADFGCHYTAKER